MPRPSLKDVFARYRRDENDRVIPYGIHTTGPILEKILRVNNKDLVLTLSLEEMVDSSDADFSGGIWTVWLSFREPRNNSIHKIIMKALTE
jgi:hypothetical protein